MWTCWNATTVVENAYEGNDCTGELMSQQIIYNGSYTFDCYNKDLCQYTMVREYLETSCLNTGSYEDIPVVVDHCTNSVLIGGSTHYKCTETAVEEYIYDSTDCSGDYSQRAIIYQNGDCGEELNNYYEISTCGDFSIDGEESKGNMDSFGIFSYGLMIMIMSHILV